MLALSLGVALSGNYDALVGVIWLTVLVTQGIRFNATALVAGLAQTLVAGVALVYLPKVFGNFVPVFFGLGAIAMIQFPEGVLTFQARQFKAVAADLRERTPRLYDSLQVGRVGYGVLIIVLLVTVRNLWWLWLAVTFVGSQRRLRLLVPATLQEPEANRGKGRNSGRRRSQPRWCGSQQNRRHGAAVGSTSKPRAALDRMQEQKRWLSERSPAEVCGHRAPVRYSPLLVWIVPFRDRPARTAVTALRGSGRCPLSGSFAVVADRLTSSASASTRRVATT